MPKVVFLIKQLLPLKYSSKYSTPNGVKYTATWRMWFGKVFNCEHVKV